MADRSHFQRLRTSVFGLRHSVRESPGAHGAQPRSGVAMSAKIEGAQGQASLGPGDHVAFRDEPCVMTCPFCGGCAVLGELDIPDQPRTFGAIHSKPTCKRFQALDVDDFIHAVFVATRPS
jgi:hypothetical protein